MGSVPGLEFNVAGSSKWTIIPEQLRSPSLYIKANSRMQLSPGGVSGDTGPGIEFRGNSISLGVGGNSAIDIDPQGKAGADKKVSEANFMRFFDGSF